MRYLILFKNGLTGTLRAVATLTRLRYLVLFSNNLAGSLSAVARLTELRYVALSANQFTGNLSWIVDLKKLRFLDLSSNLFVGDLAPVSELASLGALTKVSLFRNQLTGPVNLSGASNLQLFASFDNNLDGILLLPDGKCSLVVLLVQANRLSCAISGGNECRNISMGLASPGNRLMATPSPSLFAPTAGPSWDSTSAVSLLWCGNVWQTWRWQLIACVVGIVALSVAVSTLGVVFVPATVSPGEALRLSLLGKPPAAVQGHGLLAVRTRLWRFLHPKPMRGVGMAQMWCARSLVLLSVPVCTVMVPIFTVGPRLYSCGDTLLKYGAIAYINGWQPEWCVAAGSCVFSCAAVGLVLRFQRMLKAQDFLPRVEPPRSASAVGMASTYLFWAFPVALCSALPVAYVLSSALPDIPDGIRALVSEGTSFMLALLTTFIIPRHCRNVSHRAFGADCNPLLTSRLMQLARLWISILAPALALILIHDDCLGGWKMLWDRCRDRNYFNVVDDVAVQDSFKTVEAWIVFSNGILSRDVVCKLQYKSGRCSRAVVEQLAYLLISKLAYATFLIPAGLLVLCTPLCKRATERLFRLFKPTYIAALGVDAEFAALLM